MQEAPRFTTDPRRPGRLLQPRESRLAKADDGDSVTWKNLLAYNHVSVIVPDADRIWFGTYFYGFRGGGISYYNPQKNPPWKPFDTYTSSDLAKKIVSMAVDGDWLWVGSEKGLCLLDKKTEQWKAFYSPQKGLSGNFVNALLVDSDFIWSGTNGGISRLHKTQKTWKNYSKKEGLPDSEIKALVKVGQKIWAGAIDGSLFEYDRGLGPMEEDRADRPAQEWRDLFHRCRPKRGCSSAGITE